MGTSEFKRELRVDDLPERSQITIFEAITWLAGLPQGDLDGFQEVRLSRRLGRTEQSMRFWIHVFRQLENDCAEGPSKLDWSHLQFHDAIRAIPSEIRKERTERRIFAAARRYVVQNNSNAEDLVQEWNARLKFEVERVWAVREAASDLAEKLVETLCHPEAAAELALLIDGRGKADTGFCLSLRNDSIDAVNWPENDATKFVELWKRTKSADYRRPILLQPLLDRAKLIRSFVAVPDAVRDEWIQEKLETPHWPIAVALLFIRLQGDMCELYRHIRSCEQIGYQEGTLNLEIISISSDPFEASDVLSGSVWGWLRKKLCSGAIGARGVRVHDSSNSPIAMDAWMFLELKSHSRPSFVSLEDPTGRTNIKWEHLLIDSSQLLALVQPKLPSAEIAVDANDQVSVPKDTREKMMFWRLVEYLKREAPNAKLASHSKEQIFEKHFAGLSAKSCEQYWWAATMLLPEEIATLWKSPGKKRSNKSLD